MIATKRVLFISYPFPPVGGAGVQRATKFVKYLRPYGWEPSVLTVANPSVPVLDDSLLGDIPDGIRVCRARTWEPGYAAKRAVAGDGGATARTGGGLRRAVRGVLRRLVNLVLQPDPQVLWLPAALHAGSRLLRQVPHDAIVASGPPFSTFLLGAALGRRSGLPLVLDYRDEWNLSSDYLENQQRADLLSRWLQRRMQTQVIRAASALVATTRYSAGALRDLRDRASGSAQVTWIYNGYDPAEFGPGPGPAAARGRRYRLVYTGTLWNLTSVEPLVNAVQALARREPMLAADLELVFAGRRTASQQYALERLRGVCAVEEHPYLDHSQALNLMRTADGLCVLLSDLPGAGRVVPAKVFEYMAAARPILAVAPPGELCDLLADYPLGHRCAPADIGGIARCLEQELLRHRASAPADTAGWDPSAYSRPNQAGQLAAILDDLTRTPDSGRSSHDPFSVPERSPRK